MLNALFRSGRTVLPRCSGILVRCESTIRSLQEDLPAVRSPELLPATDYPDPCNFNYTAIMDWGLYKFDADLFKFHEVLTVDEWIELVGRGEVIESELNDMDYNKVLSTSEITTKVMERISQLGLFKLRIPTEYGGLDYNDTACAYLHEILGICPSIARVVGESEEMGVMLLKKFGTLEQKETYLPRLAKGQSFVSMAFLERGSTMLDANSYRKTNAKQVGDKFIITGRKHWVYNAKFADVFLVFATHTAQDDTGPIQLETIFLIDKNTEGVRVHSPVKKNWFRGLDLCEVIFDEVEVGFDRIVGGMGNGFKVLREVIKQNRTSTVSECSAAMKRLVHDITHRIKDDNYAKSLPALRHIEVALGEISCLAYAVETLAYYGASRNDFYAGADMTIETWLAKIFAYQALPDAIQIYFNAIGKHGFNPGTFVEELVLNAHYYPVLDDSIYDLKLALMYEIIPYIAKQLGTKLKLTKLPQDYPVESFQLRLRQAGALTFVRGLGLEECVPGEVKPAADDLERCIQRIAYTADSQITLHGRKIFNQDQILIVMAEMWALTYALTACMARALKVEYHKPFDRLSDYALTNAFAQRVSKRMKYLYVQLSRNDAELEMNCELGRKAFTDKRYLSDHPLARNF